MSVRDPAELRNESGSTRWLVTSPCRLRSVRIDLEVWLPVFLWLASEQLQEVTRAVFYGNGRKSMIQGNEDCTVMDGQRQEVRISHLLAREYP